VLERREAVALDEVVDVRQGRRHAGGERRVAGCGLARVGPDDPVAQAVQPRHLLAEQRRVAALPPVGQHDHDGAAGGAALAPTGRGTA
jgi:hypothetical protein